MNKWKALLLIVLVVVGYFTTRLAINIWKNPIMARPYPYTFPSLEPKMVRRASNANILLLGDEQAVELNNFKTQILAGLSKNLTTPLKFVNWAEEGEGLHRTLTKLQSLSKIPDLVIYLGGSQEFFEERFPLKDYQQIRHNLQAFNNEVKSSIMMILPFTSKFFYRPVKTVALPKRPVSITHPDDAKSFYDQLLIELTLAYFKIGWDDFTREIKESKKKLLVITPPLNIDLAPQKTCLDANSPAIKKKQEQIKTLLEQSRSKEALPIALDTLALNPINAQSFFLLGQVYKSMGDFKKAKSQLYRSQIYDCRPPQGTILINKLLVERAEHFNFSIIDFNIDLNKKFGREPLFISQFGVQQMYYEQLANGVRLKIKSILDL